MMTNGIEGVVADMERHVLGHEGMEDSPVARWARELREIVCQGGVDSADKDAYPLSVTDEDRDAAAWVRKYGGLGAVVTMVATLGDTLKWIRERAGIGEDEVVDYDELLEAIDRRLMPEGMEWPRFEDDTPVRFLDDFERYGEESGVSTVTMYSDGSFALNFRAYSKGERVNRTETKVLDADGAEIRVGDSVWDMGGNGPYEVVRFTEHGYVRIKSDFGLEQSAFCERLTHRAPVLAADGRPLREGETVWSVDSGTRYTVEKNTDELIPIKCRSEMGTTVSLHPSQLTHECPDSLDRLAEDIGAMVVAWRANKDLFDAQEAAAGCVGENTLGAALDSLAHRVKALTEREQ